MKRAPLTHDKVFSNEDFAEAYARQHRPMAEKFGREISKKLSARGFRKGRLIDVGCGPGALDLAISEKLSDCEILGVDLSDPLLRLAGQAAEAAGLGKRVRFEKADVQQLPFEAGSFDAAINLNMAHLVAEPVRMLDEIERVLAPGGIAFIADLRRSWLGLLESEIRSGLTLSEARELFGRSKLRPGRFTWGLIWWRFETI
jgi:ubiquinone/menaquinone biosynthesis C-methylase UbiE